MTALGGRLTGELAVVTGGEGGIGSEIVRTFLSEGATVVSLDRLAEPAEGSPVHESDRAFYLSVDIGTEASVKAAFEAIESQHGPVSVLINCAAIVGEGKRTVDVTEDEFDFIYRINVKGSWLTTKYAVPQMIARGGGSIVNFSSIAGLVGGTSANSIYHGTKGAVRLMSKHDAVSYAKDGIRVNTVHPGSVETPMAMEAAKKNPLGAEAHSKAIIDKHPLGRRGTPKEIANAVLFLASSESSFVTGTELVVDGGYTAQ